jgi:hypothetical protein
MSLLADASSAEDRMTPAKAPPRARRRQRLLPYTLALPIVLYEIALIVYPIAQGVYGSFQQIELAANSAPTWVGLANYQRMFSDPEFWQVMKTTLIFTALVIVVAIGAGLATALLFNRPFRRRPPAAGCHRKSPMVAGAHTGHGLGGADLLLEGFSVLQPGDLGSLASRASGAV